MEDYTDILTALQSRGVKASHDKATALKLRQYLEGLKGIPPLSEIGVVLLYAYRREDQPPEYRKFDGMAFQHRSGPDDTAPEYSIGISLDAVLKGKTYCQEVLLHELAHCLRGYVELHDTTYHLILDGLISKHNQATGDTLRAI